MGFYIMSGDKIIGKWKNETFTLINESLAPIYLVNTGYVINWLESRAIDRLRPNSRLLKKALRLTKKDDLSAVISVHAATITDNYWIKPFDSNLTYEGVRLTMTILLNLPCAEIMTVSIKRQIVKPLTRRSLPTPEALRSVGASKMASGI